MHEELEYFSDLALGFLNNTLSQEELRIAQELIIKNEVFLDILKTEIAIRKTMQAYKKPIPPELSKRVYLEVTTNADQLIFKKVLSLVFETALPEILQPLSKLFQRSVLVNE